MRLLGPRLFMPTLAAVTLAVYAGLYGLVLLFFSFGLIQTSFTGAFVVLGMFLLAATPFVALVHLARIKRAASDPPARPMLMAIVMLAPALFWSYIAQDLFGPYGYRNLSDLLISLLAVAAPAVLSFWLAATFALIAWRDRQNTA